MTAPDGDGVASGGDGGRPVVDPAIAEGLKRALETISAEPSPPGGATARDVAAALRELIDRFTATAAPHEVLVEATARLGEIQRLIEPYRTVRGYEGVSEASGLTMDRTHFDWSPLLGLANPVAPPIRVAVEGDGVVGRVRFGIAYEGPPGCVHGGYIAAAFDEVLGLAQSLSGRVGMTGTLDVRYRRPTPLYVDLRVEGRVEQVGARKVVASGRMYAGEVMTAESSGIFVTISPQRFASYQALRQPPGD